MNNYFNDNGLMRMHLNYEVENGLLFRFRYESYFTYWSNKNLPYKAEPHAIIAIANTIRPDGTYSANPPEKTDHFSRDNMYGLYGLCFIYRPEILKTLSVVKWNNRKGSNKPTYWKHPNGWMVFLSLRSKFYSWLFAPFIIVMILFSYYKWNRNKNKTSGLCLWFDIIPLLAKQNIVFRDLFYLIKTKYLEDVKECQDYYASQGGVWQNFDNPLRELILND